ncbi:MAG TPA: bifunctional 4-hydroxy-2-oxoglutarate aldolase/2-dehydro-3-deoxy-phosphogluconate aldolase [Steroidobacteraceae bacterium]|jgi:2-dehydro-3-deoxyphosphogluconate aldolase/(4S)-4-hydroxy-2-oxoglutarate aldolase|nr:bifunctional 4-hydroxy-2-oxoglutarate aldolase/2-dehydro-3-deoxy-phosphogluconate aldolase [Steroidobacteraceae bacterium]
MSTKASIAEILQLSPVMPVVTIEDSSAGPDLARALVRGGIKVIEVTLRTPQALAAIREIAAAVPDICVGAGTVMSPDDLERAADAGAAFAISPGATRELLAAGVGFRIPYLPAVATASELMAGLAAGYRYFKLFPANVAGGVQALKAFHGPFPEARFCPTGGITLQTAGAFLELPNVPCIGGSWLAPADLLNARDWNRIESLAREAAALRRRH